MFMPIFIPVHRDVHHYDSYSHHDSGPKYRYKEKLVVSEMFKDVTFTFKLKPQPPVKVEEHSWFWHLFHETPKAPEYEENIYVYAHFIHKDEVAEMVEDLNAALKFVKGKVKQAEDENGKYNDYTGLQKVYSEYYKGVDPDHLYLKDMYFILDKYDLVRVRDDGFCSFYERDTSEREVLED